MKCGQAKLTKIKYPAVMTASCVAKGLYDKIWPSLTPNTNDVMIVK